MPKATDVKVETGSDEIGSYTARLISDAGGLTQFGAFTETLTPGSGSSRPHWHSHEDEMIYVLTGSVTLIEDGAVTQLYPGDAATFKAGTPVGHMLRNDSPDDVTYLVVGTRSGADVVTYADTGETVTIANGTKTYRNAQGDILKTAPYHGA